MRGLPGIWAGAARPQGPTAGIRRTALTPRLGRPALTPRAPASNQRGPSDPIATLGLSVSESRAMKIRNSLKSAKLRDKNCRVVRRHGRVYVINKKNPRMKARQG